MIQKNVFSAEEIALLIETSAKLRGNGQDIRAEDLVTHLGEILFIANNRRHEGFRHLWPSRAVVVMG